MDNLNRKKVLYVITKSAWGGAQRYVYDLAVNMPPERFETAVVCGGGGLLKELLENAGIRTVAVKWLDRDINVLMDFFSFWSLVKIFGRERPDIVHLSSSKAGGLGAAAARLASLFSRRSPLVIFTVHGWGFKEDRPAWQKAIIFFLSWLSSMLHDRVILIDTADWRAAQRFIPREKLALIHNGIEPPKFMPRSEARIFIARKIGQAISPDTVLAGTIAELTKNKGLKYMIEAINRVKFQIPSSKFQVIVVGEGEERKNLQDQIKSLGLENMVHLAGFIPEASRYLKGLDIFILPSLKEGLPYTIMEAMSAGVAVVASRVGGITDLIEDKKNGLLAPPKDINALALSIRTLAAGIIERNAMAHAARTKIELEFGLNAMIENTLNLYAA